MNADAPVAVLTGASSGIGYALAKRLAPSHSVVAVARRAEPLQQLAREHPRIEPCVADVAKPDDPARIAAAVGDRAVGYLIHNAGTLEPVGPLLEQPPEAIRQSLAVNVEGPLALTRALFSRMAQGSRILHISSGAAHRALPGWGAYCTSKAALYMVYEVLKAELAGSGVVIGSLRPGVVDTPMQALIRRQAAEDFPAVEQFRALKANNQLTTPDDCARFIAAVLLDTDAGRFTGREWDIREDWASVCG
jgi:NAD(P)-dependent dehydrogenase (short-subunit alcohol dehydrogenase family)